MPSEPRRNGPLQPQTIEKAVECGTTTREKNLASCCLERGKSMNQSRIKSQRESGVIRRYSTLKRLGMVRLVSTISSHLQSYFSYFPPLNAQSHIPKLPTFICQRRKSQNTHPLLFILRPIWLQFGGMATGSSFFRPGYFTSCFLVNFKEFEALSSLSKPQSSLGSRFSLG